MNIKLRSLTLLSMVCMPASGSSPSGKSEQQPAYGYPQAEYNKAGSILMYTPGTELFDGVIHPDAGLYERYFDIDKDLCTMCFNRYDAKDANDVNESGNNQTQI